MVGMRMKIVKIPQGVPHLSLDHLDLGRASCPSSGAEWSGPVSLLIIMVMIDENFFSTLLLTGDVGQSAVDCHLLGDGVSLERAVYKSCGGVEVAEVKKIKSSQLQIILNLSQLMARRLSTAVRVSLLPSDWRVKFAAVGEHTYQGDRVQGRRG